MNFARQVRVICEPAYAEPSRGGRPGIDPVVYLKMLMIDFFENLPGDRAIAARCEDRLSARSFLGYSIQEATPDRSSFTVIRDRLSIGQLDGIHHVLLSALHTHGLLKGRKLGIDSSVIKANASLRVQPLPGIVRPAVCDGVAHALQQAFIERSMGGKDAGKSAHCRLPRAHVSEKISSIHRAS